MEKLPKTKMEELYDFIIKHSVRGACTCGKCIDAPKNPEQHQPAGHTANVEFFKVSMKDNPDPEALRVLLQENFKGEYCNLDLFDGKEHGYIEIGGWIGDQSAALILMGVGKLLGLWELFTPTSMGMPSDIAMRMAEEGLVTIKVI